MYDINVAGVTFANSDGEHRQDILKNLGFGYYNAVLKQTTFENERAVEVWINDKQVGYIPRSELDNQLSFSPALFAQIYLYKEKDIYCVTLSEFITPSYDLQHDMNTYCAAKGLPMPINDVRAYSLFTFQMNN